MTLRTVDEARIFVDTGYDGSFAVVVSWIWIKWIVFILSWTPHTEYILTAATFLIWPIAAVDAVVEHESIR